MQSTLSGDRSRSRSPGAHDRYLTLPTQLPDNTCLFLQGIQFSLYELGRTIRITLGALPTSFVDRCVYAFQAGVEGSDCPHSFTRVELNALLEAEHRRRRDVLQHADASRARNE